MPYYSLTSIRQLVSNIDNVLLSRSAQRDGLNLGYFKADIARCVGLLNEADFLKTHNYEGIILDAYKIQCNRINEEIDPVYIKLKIVSDNRIYIASFHRNR